MPKRRANPKFRRNVARRIAELRKRAGLTQPEAAARAKVDERHLQKLEAGRADMGLRMAHVLARAYGVDPSELLAPAGSPVLRPATADSDEPT